MNWIEIVLLILGAGAFVVSFLISGKSQEDKEARQIDEDIIKDIIDKELSDAKERVSEVIDETLEYAVEKTERASERISNEKIMAISEYSETVLSDVNKAHQEVMFLYDMLNDKHNNLKETIKHVDKTAKEAQEAADAAAIALAAKAKEDAEAKEKEQRDIALERAAQDKAAREKELARRQMARLILPMQQELPMYHSNDARLDRQALLLNQHRQIQDSFKDNQGELRPLVVKSVEVLSSDVIPSADIRSASGVSNTGRVSAADLQTLGTRPENLKVVDAKPADLRQVEVYSFAEQAPRVERPVKKETQPQTGINTGGIIGLDTTGADNGNENNNDRILRLHKEGMSNVDIAKELGLGVGEVKLVINLFKGAV